MWAGFCHIPVAYWWVSQSTNRSAAFSGTGADRRRDHVRLLNPMRGMAGRVSSALEAAVGVGPAGGNPLARFSRPHLGEGKPTPARYSPRYLIQDTS